MATVTHNIAFTKGDTHQLQVTDIGKVDKMYMTVKCSSNLLRIQKTYYADPRVGTSNGIELQEDGTYLITLEPSDTDHCKAGQKYNYDIQITIGQVKATIVKGTIKLEEEITCKRNEV